MIKAKVNPSLLLVDKLPTRWQASKKAGKFTEHGFVGI